MDKRPLNFICDITSRAGGRSILPDAGTIHLRPALKLFPWILSLKLLGLFVWIPVLVIHKMLHKDASDLFFIAFKKKRLFTLLMLRGF